MCFFFYIAYFFSFSFSFFFLSLIQTGWAFSGGKRHKMIMVDLVFFLAPKSLQRLHIHRKYVMS